MAKYPSQTGRAQKLYRHDVAVNGPRRISAEVPRRKLQALQAIGWNGKTLAEHCGRHRRQLDYIATGECQWVGPEWREIIDRLYDELSNIRPDSLAAHRCRLKSARKGWLPPLAWDDIEYDHAPYDPYDVPEVSPIEQYLELRQLGYKDWQIAKRFGISEDSLQRRLQRAA
jgi:hypothetical protein